MTIESYMAVFVRVADLGGLAPAARDLGLTPSAVSKSIRRIEDRLGARLLNRTTRRVSLTEAGERYYNRVVCILADIEEAERTVGDLQGEVRGLLRVSSAIAFAELRLVPALPLLFAQYPELEIDIAMSDSLVDIVAEGFDVAIRIQALPDSSMIARRITKTSRVICASPEYIAKYGAPQHPDDLHSHACLRLDFSAELNQWAFMVDGKKHEIPVSGPLKTNNFSGLYQAALAGLGLLRSSNYLVQPELDNGGLVTVLDDYAMESDLAIHAVYPPTRHLSPKVRAFVDFLVGPALK